MPRPKVLKENTIKAFILEVEQVVYLERQVGYKGSVSKYVRALIDKDMESKEMSTIEQEASP